MTLLETLCDGETHSGVQLAQVLHVSRTAVWKSIERLRGRGIDIRSQPRSGYRLAAPVELIDAARIRASLGTARDRLESLAVPFEVDSTNTVLLDAGPPPFGMSRVCLCELQTHGRGRRGRPWMSVFGHSLMLSLSWHFSESPRSLPALSLAAGVAVVRALRALQAHGLGLKWPNDIWLHGQKVGGLLIEIRAEASGPTFLVLGLGLNIFLAENLAQRIERAGASAAALSDCMPMPISRNAIAASVINELILVLSEYAQRGFAAYRPEWCKLDVLRDQPAQVRVNDQSVQGTARGVDEEGMLLLQVDGALRRFGSGEASLVAM